MKPAAWVNGNFVTMDRARPRASAIAVADGRIVYVGSDREAIEAAEGAAVRDLGGSTVIPGFNDNHVHAVYMGDHELAPDLSGLDGPEIVALLKTRYPDPVPGEIIRAFNWDYPSCPNPRKELLDEAFPRNPVVLIQFSGHAQWLNSAALRANGLDRIGTKSGCILRDRGGEPTGIVRDLPDSPLSKKRNRSVYFDERMREERIGIALGTFARCGITSVQDNAWYFPQLLGLRKRFAAGGLTARFALWSRGSLLRQRAAMEAAFALGVGVPDWIREGPVKFFVDGTFSTRNACLFEPFLNARPEEILRTDPKPPTRELDYLARKGRQGAFHVIGDKGIALFLDAYEEALRNRPGLRDLRIRIEHAQLVREADIERIARLGILVAAQPTALGAPEKDEKLLGRERALRAYPYRSLLEAGVKLSFGSDIPGECFCDPIRAIHLAVNRDGPERIPVETALRCYTEGSAYAEFAEDRKGTLSPGKLADFAIISQDITAVPAGKIKETVVVETVVGGKSVYRRSSKV